MKLVFSTLFLAISLAIIVIATTTSFEGVAVLVEAAGTKTKTVKTTTLSQSFSSSTSSSLSNSLSNTISKTLQSLTPTWSKTSSQTESSSSSNSLTKPTLSFSSTNSDSRSKETQTSTFTITGISHTSGTKSNSILDTESETHSKKTFSVEGTMSSETKSESELSSSMTEPTNTSAATQSEALTVSDDISGTVTIFPTETETDILTPTDTITGTITANGTLTNSDSVTISNYPTSATPNNTESQTESDISKTKTKSKSEFSFTLTNSSELTASDTLQIWPPYSSPLESANVGIASTSILVGIVSTIVGGSSPLTVLTAQRVQMLATFRKCRSPDPEYSLSMVEHPLRFSVGGDGENNGENKNYGALDTGAAIGNTLLIGLLAGILFLVAKWKTVSKDRNLAEALNNIFMPPILCVIALILWQPTVAGSLGALAFGNGMQKALGFVFYAGVTCGWCLIFYFTLVRTFRPLYTWKRVQEDQVVSSSSDETSSSSGGALLKKGDWNPHFWYCVQKPIPRPPKRMGPESPMKVMLEKLMFRSGEWRVEDKVLRGVHKPGYIAHLPSVARGAKPLSSLMNNNNNNNQNNSEEDEHNSKIDISALSASSPLRTNNNNSSSSSCPDAKNPNKSSYHNLENEQQQQEENEEQQQQVVEQLTRQEYFWWRNAHDAFFFFVTDRCRWFLLIEWFLSMIWGILDVVSRKHSCSTAGALLFLPMIVYIVLLIYLRPFSVGFDNLAMILIAILQTFCIIFVLLAVNTVGIDAWPNFNSESKYMQLNEGILLFVGVLILLRSLSDLFRILRTMKRDRDNAREKEMREHRRKQQEEELQQEKLENPLLTEEEMAAALVDMNDVDAMEQQLAQQDQERLLSEAALAAKEQEDLKDQLFSSQRGGKHRHGHHDHDQEENDWYDATPLVSEVGSETDEMDIEVEMERWRKIREAESCSQFPPRKLQRGNSEDELDVAPEELEAMSEKVKDAQLADRARAKFQKEKKRREQEEIQDWMYDEDGNYVGPRDPKTGQPLHGAPLSISNSLSLKSGGVIDDDSESAASINNNNNFSSANFSPSMSFNPSNKKPPKPMDPRIVHRRANIASFNPGQSKKYSRPQKLKDVASVGAFLWIPDEELPDVPFDTDADSSSDSSDSDSSTASSKKSNNNNNKNEKQKDENENEDDIEKEPLSLPPPAASSKTKKVPPAKRTNSGKKLPLPKPSISQQEQNEEGKEPTTTTTQHNAPKRRSPPSHPHPPSDDDQEGPVVKRKKKKDEEEGVTIDEFETL